MTEQISVIIPTYNRRAKLQGAMESVLGQTYGNLELIVVDDGSTDGTEEMVRAMSDERIRYHRLPVNGGVSHARNEGVRLAKNETIAFQDSDDCWRAEKLAMQMEYWKAHSDCVLIYTAYAYDNRIRVPEIRDKEQLEGEIYPWLLCRNTIGTGTMLTRRETFLKAGGFDETLPALEDWDLAIRMAKEGSIGYVDQVLVDASASAGGVSSSAANYYTARCRLIARYREDLMRLGLFDGVVADVFHRAESSGVLESVKKMLMLYLSEG